MYIFMLSESPSLMITCRYWVLSQRFHIKQSQYKLRVIFS